MAGKVFGPRKRRTRQHVIADLAVHHVEGFILEAGHTAERTFYDYGYDLVMTTFDSDGYPEPGVVFLQVKACSSLVESAHQFVHDVDIRDYHVWMNERLPVIFILYDAARWVAVWLDIKTHFSAEEARRPKRGAKWVRVRIPIDRRLDRAAIETIRGIKARVKGITGE